MKQVRWCLTHDRDAGQGGCKGLFDGGDCDILNVAFNEQGRWTE